MPCSAEGLFFAVCSGINPSSAWGTICHAMIQTGLALGKAKDFNFMHYISGLL